MEKTSSIRARDLPQQSKRNASWKDCPNLQLMEFPSSGEKLSSATLKRLKERFGLIPAKDQSSLSEKDQSDDRSNDPQSRSASELTVTSAAASGSKRHRQLADSHEMSSLLSMLRTEEVCVELDIQRHFEYHGKQNAREFLTRRRLRHFLCTRSDSAISNAQVSCGGKDSRRSVRRSVKKAKTSSHSTSTPELSQKTI